MSHSAPSPDEDRRDESAAEWLYEREGGFTEERARAFACWCEADRRNADAVWRAERTLELLNAMSTVRAPLKARLARARSEVGSPRIWQVPLRSWFAYLGGVAATLLIGLALWRTVSPSAPLEQRYATDTIAERSISLPDGSVIDLNTGSKLSVQFTREQRRVVLQEGEAHFQVAHDKTRPFVVTAGDISVRAVGTAFDVRLATEVVSVAVDEGRVELARNAGGIVHVAADSTPSVTAGEIVRVARDNPSLPPQIEVIDGPTLRALVIWKNPMTSFTDVPLRDVVARFNRRNATQVILVDPDLGARRIGGVFALEQVDFFVRFLEQDNDVVADRSVAGRISLHRGR